ncbi:sugar nucleotide-binding protein [Polynucleobacter paneuropaeus]|nr:sugar nucleotide-binding protein [Polynucleobacter paneuropaeus]
MPHQLAEMCTPIDAKLILISADYIFSDAQHIHQESDQSDNANICGKYKYLDEVATYSNIATLRTSTIGYEFQGTFSLLERFLS